jgi:23S rRNA (guanosine2251-2'-O)-methyltransferase
LLVHAIDRKDRQIRCAVLQNSDERSPRERYITVFGRNAVLEALQDVSLHVAQVFVASDVSRPILRQIEAASEGRGISVNVVTRDKVTRISGTGKQHQGVAADIEAPNKRSLSDWLEQLPESAPARCVLLDGVTTPANVGMIMRSAVAAGLDGIVIPTRGVADLGPLVIKASAGQAFRAPLLRIRTALEAAQMLQAHGFELLALDQDGQVDLWEAELGPRTALVLGGERAGVSEEVTPLLSRTVRIPMADGVESLNVSAAAAVAFFELRRRGI